MKWFLPYFAKMKKFAWELAISVAIGVAAIAPLGRYDPHLAVLAITAVAVVWYTGATFRALSHAEGVRFEEEAAALALLHTVVLEFRTGLREIPPELPPHRIADKSDLIARARGLIATSQGRWALTIWGACDHVAWFQRVATDAADTRQSSDWLEERARTWRINRRLHSANVKGLQKDVEARIRRLAGRPETR